MGCLVQFVTHGATQACTVSRAQKIQILTGQSQEEVQEVVLQQWHLSAASCKWKTLYKVTQATFNSTFYSLNFCFNTSIVHICEGKE